jgi:hypothetical protein
MNEGPILALGGLLFFVLFVAWGILTKNRNGNGTGYRSYNHCQVGRVRLDY